MLGTRGAVVLSILAAAAWAWWALGLDLATVVPNEGGLALARAFFGRALSPALASEADFVPPDTPPLLLASLRAAATTVVYAAAAMSLSLALGVLLGFLASTAWWAGDAVGGPTWPARTGPARLGPARTVAPALYVAARLVLGFMRSVHELLWAVLFMAAFGLTPLAAVLAIAIPYGGTLGKVFSEMVDEAPRGAAAALRGAGASGLQVFAFGLVPRALPDMTAYAFYRFECALRSSAVLGFFGVETIGREIRQAFESANFGEVWTHLYVLMAIVIVFDAWSGRLRRRFLP